MLLTDGSPWPAGALMFEVWDKLPEHVRLWVLRHEWVRNTARVHGEEKVDGLWRLLGAVLGV